MSDVPIQPSIEVALRESEAKFATLLETASIAIVLVNQAGNLVLANAKAEELFDYPRAELIGQTLELLIPDRFRAIHAQHREGYQGGPHVRSMGVGLDLAGRRRDGTEFPVEVGLSYIHTAEGLLTMAFITSIAERKAAEEALRHYAVQQAQLRTELEQYSAALEQRVAARTFEVERRRAVAEGLRDILTALNTGQPLTEVLDTSVALAGRLLATDATALYQLDAANGQLTVAAARGLTEDYVQLTLIGRQGAAGAAVQERRAVVVEDVRLLPAMAAFDGGGDQQAAWAKLAQHYPARLAVPLMIKAEVYGAIVLYYTHPRPFSQEEVELAITFADQAALAIENARLRVQVEQSAVAAERTRLARDLHDAVTQTLFAASMIAEVLPRLWERKPDEGRRRLEELRQLTRGALAEMRTLLYELRPTVLTQTALNELIYQLSEAITGRTRIPIFINCTGDGKLPPDVQLAFYRIAQEALNNIAKHSGATMAWVNLDLRDEPEATEADFAIKDNGHGFDLEAVAPQRLGLEIMRERAAAIGARLEIQSRIETGTLITVTWQAEQPHD